eukprot:scaffold46943_cov90-Cyclotella_meneghiniana.AAC.1
MNPHQLALSKSSLKWPTLAVQFNNFFAVIGQPKEHVIHHKTYREEHGLRIPTYVHTIFESCT